MPLSLISGPTGSGKTRMVLERLAPFANAQAGLCIVPSDAAAFELRQEFLKDRPAVLGDLFVTWNHFIKNTAATERPVISVDEQSLLIYRLLSQASLSYFRSPSMGVARYVAETITALKKNLMTFEDLSKLISTRKVQRERDLLKLFGLYEEEKARHGFVDDGDLFLDTLSGIKNAKRLGGLKFIAFDGFHHFTRGQIAMIEILSKTDVRLLVTLPAHENDDALFAQYLKGTHDTLKKLASTSETTKRTAQTPKIRNIVLRSPFQETRFVAHEIASAVKKGVPPEKIALCIRKGDFRLLDILTELEAAGLARKTRRLGAPMSAPLLHESLSQKLTESLPPSATIDEYAKSLLSIMKKVHDEEALESSFDKDAGDFGHEIVARSLNSLAGLESLLRSLQTMSQVAGPGTVTREIFLNLVLSQSLDLFLSPHDLSQITPVRISYFEDGTAFEPELLFICHLTEGNIPASFPERLFFSGEPELAAKLSDIFPTPADLLAHEAFFFHRLTAKARGEIVLSHPAIDHSGKEAPPSSFLDPYGDPHPYEAPLPKFDTGKLDDVIAIEKERSIGDARHPQYHGMLVAKNVRELIRKRFTDGKLTPSQIETYAGCPFKFFVEHVLNLREPEEITPEILPKDFGTIIHAILERFYRNHPDLFKKAVADPKNIKEIDRVLEGIVKEVFADKAELIGYAAKGLKPYEQKVAKALVLQVISHEAEDARLLAEPLSPTEFEWSFGKKDETALRVKIDGDADGLVRGRVDRIDTSDDGSRFEVIDYKTGRQVDSIASKIKKGLHVQIPLYVEAVGRFLFPKATALGGMLFAVRKPETKHGFLKKEYNDVNFSISKRSKSVVGEDEWDEMLKAALENTAKHIAAIRRADFGVRPVKCDHFCNYEDVCRYCQEGTDALAEACD